jgi:hypothetical protein
MGLYECRSLRTVRRANAAKAAETPEPAEAHGRGEGGGRMKCEPWGFESRQRHESQEECIFRE